MILIRSPDYTEVISVTVNDGTTASSFLVHKHVLTSSSEYFQKACAEPWVRNNSVVSPVATRPTVEKYVHWLYTGEIRLAAECGICGMGCLDHLEEKVDVDGTPMARRNGTAYSLARLYVASDVLLDYTFKTALIDEFFRLSKIAFNLSTTSYLWNHVSESDKIRALLTDVYATGTIEKSFWTKAKGEGGLPLDFFVELAQKLSVDAAGRRCPSYAQRHHYYPAAQTTGKSDT
jgi:hypothetical protein